MNKYHTFTIDGAIGISSPVLLTPKQLVGIMINEALCFYSVKNIRNLIPHKGSTTPHKNLPVAEFKGEHKIVDGDTEDTTKLVKQQKFHKQGKLYQVVSNKKGVMETTELDYILLKNISHEFTNQF